MNFSKLQIVILVIICNKLAISQNISAISIAICEIIDKFYAKYSQNLDIIDFDGSNSELVGHIMKNVNNSMTLT